MLGDLGAGPTTGGFALSKVLSGNECNGVTWSFLWSGQRSCSYLCLNMIAEYSYFCLDPSESEWAYQRAVFCETIYVKQEMCKT